MAIVSGQKGRFKASGLEFEITNHSFTGHSCLIRYRWERTENEAEDEALRKDADAILEWGGKVCG